MSGYKNVAYIFIQRILYNYIVLWINHIKWNPATCNNMDEPGWHDVKWNEPDTERQILYDLAYMWNIKYSNGA